ncbi:phage tail tape measure protein [uncultured Amphritea sp.]|uniref:phage tail tape measure protein n=1 Tax=uncultured Amphritea sp. TaxID=981605 RepID=UPI0025F11C94|nr:phage tail tape measure protein [uncultured Amphritea sp.]
MQALEKLMFAIGIVDQVSKPLAKIDKQISSVAVHSRQGFMNAGIGAAGLAASGYLLQRTLGPALEMQKALGEVESLGVHGKALSQLNRKAFMFSVKYGESATDFVSSSYDIQSAIAGLTGNELSEFTNASGVLAKATKADAGTITDYMGTMYGIFKNDAAAMGKADWVNMVAGRTAAAVQMFKTTGAEMSGAFTSLGANANAAGIQLEEQMAILGTLQATMSGSEAGTKYKAFLAGVGKAQSSLGLQFTDSEGRLLPMLNVLEQIKGKFGDTLNVSESDALKSAFGSDEAVSMIKLLMADTDGLAGSIDSLGNVKGLSKAEQMAKAMVDPWDRWSAGITAVQIGIGQSLLPVLNPLIEMLSDTLAEMAGWTQMYPNLTRWIGYAVLTIIGMTAAVAAFNLAIGVSQIAIAAWGVAGLALTGIMKTLEMVMLLGKAAVWLFNAALWANPITWIVAAVILLIAAVGALIYYWDDLVSAIASTDAFQFLLSIVESIVTWFKSLGGIVDWVLDKLDAIPGIELGRSSLDVKQAAPSLSAPQQLKTTPGGISQQISNAISNQGGNTYHVGIESKTAPGPAELSEWLAMEGA